MSQAIERPFEHLSGLIPEQRLQQFANSEVNPVLRNMGQSVSPLLGRHFEVGGLRDQGTRGEGQEAMILRDGRLILANPRGAGEAGEEQGTERAARPGELHRVHETSGAVLHGTGKAETHSELSLFEKVFLAHFEGGLPVTPEMLQEGHFKFLPKTEQSWADFFKAFAAFTLLKGVKAGDIQALVFRGLMTPEGKLTPEAKALLTQAKGVLVSDLKLEGGQTDKFARLAIMSEPMMKELSKLSPGDVITQSVFADLVKQMGGDDLQYLSLSHKVVNPDMAKAFPSAATEAYQSPEKMRETALREGMRDATPGIALSAKTEQMIAKHLDIDLKPGRVEIGMDRRGGEMVKGAGSASAGLLGDKKKRRGGSGAGNDDSDSPVFVPWYQHVFPRKTFKGKPRWWVPLIYFVTTSAIVFSLIYIFRYWMH